MNTDMIIIKRNINDIKNLLKSKKILKHNDKIKCEKYTIVEE